MTDMKNVMAAMTYFKKLQKEQGFIDNGNVVRDKWDMRAVMDDIDDDIFLKKLFKFFLTFSDDKSRKAFFENYADYKESLETYLQDRAARKELAKKTVRGKS